MAKLIGENADCRWQDGESLDTYEARATPIIEKLREAGKIVKWGRGDGYAIYEVVSVKPPVLRHLPYGDAWTVEDALIRGLRAEDLQKLLDGERRMRELFGGKVGA